MPDISLRDQNDTIRVPLYSEGSNRTYQAGASDYIQPDSILMNCWAEPQQNGDTYITKRPGLAFGNLNLSGVVNNVNTLIPYNIIGISGVNIRYIAAIGDTSDTNLYILSINEIGGTPVKIGTIAGWSNVAGMKVHLTEIVVGGVTGVAIAVQNGTNTLSLGYYALTTAGAFTAASLTLISDVDYPANVSGECTVGPFVQLNQHIFIMGRTGSVYNSDQDSISSWNVRGIQPASIEPDRGLGLCKYKQHIVAFGDTSIEFFEDAGLAPPGGPLQRTEQAFIKFGTVNSTSFINIDDTIYWVSNSTTETRGLWKLDQYTPVLVSPPWVSTYFYPTPSYLRLGAISLGGLKHLLINGIHASGGAITPIIGSSATFTPFAGAATETWPVISNDLSSQLLCYAIGPGTWWAWTDGNVSNVQLCVAHSIVSGSLVNPNQVILKLSGLQTTGGVQSSNMYTLTDGIQGAGTLFTDANGDGVTDSPVCVTIQLAPLEFNVETRKRINKLKVIMDGVTPYSGDASTGYQMYVVYNRKDGLGSMITRNIPLPQTNHRYVLNNLGTARKLYISLVSRTKMPMRLKALELNVSQGTH